jgi:hypothetical protein
MNNYWKQTQINYAVADAKHAQVIYQSMLPLKIFELYYRMAMNKALIQYGKSQ